MRTYVRGQEILLSPSAINKYLDIENPAKTVFPQRSDGEIHQLLMPGTEVGPLQSLRPTHLHNFEKLVYYLYSRIMVNKAQNYTHFTRQDHFLLASILAQDTWNVGDWIFDQLEKMHKRPKTRHLPFPTLVSLILKQNKIWYLDQKALYIYPVSREKNLLRSGIFIPGVAERREEERAETEAQSSAPSQRQSRSRSPRISTEPPQVPQLDRVLEAINASRAHVDQRLDGLHQKMEEMDDHLGDSVAELKMHIQVLEYKLASLQQSSQSSEPQPQVPKIATVIEVPLTSPLASLFPTFTTPEATIFIPLLHPLTSTTHLTTPPIYIPTPLTSHTPFSSTTSPSQPTIPTPIPAIPHTTIKPQNLNPPPPPSFEDPPEDSISFQRTLFEEKELFDDASTLVDNDKKGEKNEEEKNEGNEQMDEDAEKMAEDVRGNDDDDDVVIIETIDDEPIIEEPRDPADDALAIVPYVPPCPSPEIEISRAISSLLATLSNIPMLLKWPPEN